MMQEVQTPEGKLFWLSDLENPLAGSALVIVKLLDAAEVGVQAVWPGSPVVIDLKNFSDVRFALEVMYGDEAKFGPDAPAASDLIPPFDPEVIY